MRAPKRTAIGLVLTIVATVGGAPLGSNAAIDPVDAVDPMIGTLGAGFVFPGPAAPYGMVQLSPDTDGYFAYTGYQWIDAFIRGFSHVHVQSMGVPEGGNIPFMPTTGAVSTDVERYKSLYSHALETADVGSYKVTLLSYGIDAELTAGLRVGMHRYTFPPGAEQNVLLDIGRQIPGGEDNMVQRLPGTNLASVEIRPDERTVLGTANVDLRAEDHYPVHFAARFDRPFASYGVWESRGAALQQGVAAVQAQGAGAAVSFAPEDGATVLVKVGISFTSPDAALANLEAELPGDDFGFDALRARTVDAWRDALGTITVEGGTPLDQTSFYTALYHAQHHPNVFNDVDGSYLGHDGAVHRIGAPGDPMPAGSTYYANFSLWDTYRGEMPLLMLIAPERIPDMMRSWRAIIRQGGRLPRWSLMNVHADFMNGEPALQSFADAYCRGLVPPDVVGELYADARRLALVDRRDPSYLTHGYVPVESAGSGASSTLEHAIGDFALALVAHGLNEPADRDALLAQASNWRNVFDPETRFVRPRHADGSWVSPYHPEFPKGFREGTGWQYTWLAPHDAGGLFDAMGGDAAVRGRLDTFFAMPASAVVPYVPAEAQQKLSLYGIAYYGNQYSPANEHDLHAPYLYDWTSEPWKTQALARQYQSLYRPTPDGLPGNDDLGTMSAWFIWSALGFYPVIAGAPVYVVGSPLFERATIRPASFTVDAPGASLLKYIGSAALNGAPLERTWFTHDDLTPGGSLRFELGPVPGSWGADGPPPSQSLDPLETFACAP